MDDRSSAFDPERYSTFVIEGTTLDFPDEYWNGADESDEDTPSDFEPIVVSNGSTVNGNVDIYVIDVESKDFKLVKITATTPQDWTVWSNEISTVEIKVSSENSERSGVIVNEQYTFYTRQKGFYIPGFDPTITILALAGLAAVGVKKKHEE